MKDAKNVPHQN